MIAIAQVIGLLEAEGLDQLRRITLVCQHGLPQRQVVRILFVVAGADKVACVAFAQELGQRAAGEDRAIIQMRSNERQDLSLMRLAGVRSLGDHLVGGPA
jgi:hypothetical protein